MIYFCQVSMISDFIQDLKFLVKIHSKTQCAPNFMVLKLKRKLNLEFDDGE